MNYRAFAITLITLIVTSCSTHQPTGQRVDYIRVPQQTLINSQNPIFSWLVAQESLFQSGYQVVVSSDEQCSEGDMWDSGKVEGDNNYAVEYGGDKLQSSESYYWKVRYWDTRGRKSQYSKIQKFTIAPHGDSIKSIVTDNPLLKREDHPVAMKTLSSGEHQFDFGKSAFGTISFEMEVKEDTTILLRLGEQLTAQGNIEREPRGNIRYQEVEVELKRDSSIYNVSLPINPKNTGKTAIPVPQGWGVILPFRYLEVANLGGNKIESMKPTRAVMYGYREPLGEFSSSNNLLDSIWDISSYTIEATDFMGYYIDGDRERRPYEADAYINQLCHYCIDSEYAIAKKSLEYFMSYATWPTEWLLHTIMVAYQDYIYSGDKRIIREYYDLLKGKTLHELAREDGLISSLSDKATPVYLESIGFKGGFKHMADIVDWPKEAFTKSGMEIGERDSYDMVEINTVVNCFYYHAATLMSELAYAIDKEEDAKYFEEIAERVKSSINSKLFDSEKGIYIDGEGSEHSALHSNMAALAFGIVESENIKSVGEFVKSRGMACSVYGAQYLFEALYNAQEAEYALELMTNRSDRGWYNMIKIGSTMTLEAWDIKYKGNLDWNHAWGAAPANIIPRYMWGIRPTAVGYREAVIKPQLTDLEHSEISVPTLQGVIHGSYVNSGGVKSYSFSIPANMVATFESVDPNSSIIHNGTKADGNTIKLLPGEHTISL